MKTQGGNVALRTHPEKTRDNIPLLFFLTTAGERESEIKRGRKSFEREKGGE